MSTLKVGKKIQRKRDIHRLTESSRAEDPEDDETGEEAERTGTSQPREL